MDRAACNLVGNRNDYDSGSIRGTQAALLAFIVWSTGIHSVRTSPLRGGCILLRSCSIAGAMGMVDPLGLDVGNYR